MSAAPAATGAPALVVRRMRWWDVAAVAALEGPLFGAHAWSAAQVWSELARVPESRWYVVALRGEQLVGYAGLFAVPPEADIQTVAVAPQEQGRGTGGILVSALLRRSMQLGVTALRLEVRADNAPALRLYERLGFTVDGRRRDYYGRGSDAMLMSRRVDTGGGGDG